MASDPYWQYLRAVPDGESLEIGGVNVWDHPWRDTGKRVSVKDTLYHQEFVAPVFTAVIRERVARDELSRFVPAACGEVWSFIPDAGLPRPGRHLALYGADGMVEAGVEVGSPFTGSSRVLGSQLPSGRAITMVHHGPYDRLGVTHARIREWCEVQGLRSAGICWELYGHWEEEWNEEASLIRNDVFHLLEEP